MKKKVTPYKKFDIEEEFRKVEKLCKKYGYRCYLRFDEIVIQSKCESWYFVPTENGFIRLMHGNSMGQNSNHYHKQFDRKLTYGEILTYINEHEKAKYIGKTMDFTFTKTGARKTSNSRF